MAYLRILIVRITVLMFIGLTGSLSALPRGTIQGRVVDKDTQAPLIGANVLICGTAMGAATDMAGEFEITAVPPGSYSIKCMFIGYETVMRTDIVVRSGRVTPVHFQLPMTAVETEAVSVTAGYFTGSRDQTASSAGFSHEEIRRAPGSAGDVSRILMILPAVAKVNDQSNNLVVRGGNPMENTFYIDHIEIPNINHFPMQGASGGPIGILNVDFIQDVTFHTGGFSPQYGDKLSAVMDITFREGSRDSFEGQLDLNFAGFGGVAEGPLGPKGSWLFSARRSYLDMVVKMLNVGSTVAPAYGDFQGKLAWDLNPAHRLVILGIYADDHNAPDREAGLENQMDHYGSQDLYHGTAGITWRGLWGKSGYSNTSLSFNGDRYDEDFYETNTAQYEIKNRSREMTAAFRNTNHFRLSPAAYIEFGVETKYLISDFDNWYARRVNAPGDTVPELVMNTQLSAGLTGGFINWILKPFARFTVNCGLRGDYFSMNRTLNISPRLSASYQLNAKTRLIAAWGLYSQHLPLVLLGRYPGNRNLKNPQAAHYIAGFEHLIRDDTRFTLEAYQKDYTGFPMDPGQPALFVLDDGFLFHSGPLVSTGKARTRGVEVMLQKKLARNFYGLSSAAFFRSKYEDLNGVWRDRSFDNRIIFSVEGGYKPNRSWEFSLRWIYAGGVPYTPIDTAASALVHRAVEDSDRIHASRYPDYHSMNIRFDRRFQFRGSNLIIYISIWNVYDRKNIAGYFWNDAERKIDCVTQWRLLPIFGLEYEI